MGIVERTYQRRGRLLLWRVRQKATRQGFSELVDAIDKGINMNLVCQKVWEETCLCAVPDCVGNPLDLPYTKALQGSFIDWIWEHREEILEFILMLIALFSTV